MSLPTPQPLSEIQNLETLTTFEKKTVHPLTGSFTEATWYENCFGDEYGIVFAGEDVIYSKRNWGFASDERTIKITNQI